MKPRHINASATEVPLKAVAAIARHRGGFGPMAQPMQKGQSDTRGSLCRIDQFTILLAIRYI
jgi:hypothetical protein